MTFEDRGAHGYHFLDGVGAGRCRCGSGVVGGGRHTGLNMRRAAREWGRSNEAAEAIIQRLPRSQWLDVRYESLCEDPHTVLRNACEFLGMDPDRIVVDFRSRPHHVVGNGMRFDLTSEIRLDQRWRKALTPDQLRDFEAVAGHLNRRYGYQ